MYGGTKCSGVIQKMTEMCSFFDHINSFEIGSIGKSLIKISYFSSKLFSLDVNKNPEELEQIRYFLLELIPR